MSEINYKHLDGDKESKLFKFGSYIIAISVFVIKVILVCEFWRILLSLDYASFINQVIQDEFWRGIITFLNKSSCWIGIILCTFEVLLQAVLRFKIFNKEASLGMKLLFLNLNWFTFPFVIGFFPECILTLNEVNVSTDENFFIDIWYMKIQITIFIVTIILICLGCVFYSICCGRGEYLGTTKNTTYYYSGRTSVNYEDHYDADYESAGLFCFSGMKCGLILVICIMTFFPFFIGITSYVYTLAYMKNPFYQTLFILEFLLNFLFIYFFTLTYK